MGGANEKPPLIVKELPRLPVELHRYMRALVQKRPDLPSMANRESMQGLMIALLESKPNPRTTLEQIDRSEERRVGKECTVVCRSRWSPYH